MLFKPLACDFARQWFLCVLCRSLNVQYVCHFTCVVARSNERAAGDHAESESSHLLANLIELFRRTVSFDRSVFSGRLQVLAQRQHVDTDRSQVRTDFE